MYSKFYERFYSWRVKYNASFEEFFAYIPNRIYLGLTLFLQAFSWLFSYYIFKNLTGALLVLHYNVDFGINWIGDPYKIFYFPAVSFLIFLSSLVMVLVFGPSKNFRFQSDLLMLSALLSNLGMISALLLVYLINFK